MKKSQTSIEFAILISIIITFLLILISVFVDFSSIANDKRETQSQEIWAMQDIALKEMTWDGENLSCLLQNNLPYDITLSTIEINHKTYSLTESLSSGEQMNLKKPLNYSSASIRINYTNLKNNNQYSVSAPKVYFEVNN
ncbi:MAG: hypothetical protein ACOCP4_06990 [Candidatus Woesearchaeota archaeon]